MDPEPRHPPAPAHCSLCGGPNDCARSRATATHATEDAPCWCVDRRFPPDLLARARERDGGAACVCPRCLDASAAASTAGRNAGGLDGSR